MVYALTEGTSGLKSVECWRGGESVEGGVEGRAWRVWSVEREVIPHDHRCCWVVITLYVVLLPGEFYGSSLLYNLNFHI